MAAAVADDVHVLCTSVVLARPPAARRACRLSFLQELWQGSVVERHVVVLALSTCDWGRVLLLVNENRCNS